MQVRIVLAMVRSNTLLLWDSRDKDACIRKRLELTDGAVVALMAPWWG